MKTKLCPNCKELLSVSAFNKSNRRDGFQTYCRACHNKMQRKKYAEDPAAKVKRQLRANRRKERDPFVARKAELKRLYGITFDDYIKMFIQQGEVCAICKNKCKTKKMLSVDHDHKTGKIRGLLCNRCNAALGMLRDDPTIIKRALYYIEHSEYN
jgi:hypothetical protein